MRVSSKFSPAEAVLALVMFPLDAEIGEEKSHRFGLLRRNLQGFFLDDVTPVPDL